MSARPRHLPRELIDAVIDELRDETACLLACALVHSTWRVRAQYHLYRDIIIPILRPVGKGNRELFSFANSLEENRELGRLVHSVTIEGSEDDGADGDSSGTDPPLDIASFEVRCNALLPFIPLLERVAEVTLEDCVDDTKWPSLPVSLQSAILGLCFQPSVTNLHLVAVEAIPVLPFAKCHHLECLELAFNDIPPDPAELDASFPLNSRDGPTQSLVSPAPRRQLSALFLNNMRDETFLRYLFMEGVLQSSALKELSLRSDRWGSPQAKADLLQVFDLCRDTLATYEVVQRADLDDSRPQEFPKSLLQLDLIPNLQSLSFELNYYYLEMIPEQRDVICEITEALKLLSPVPGNAALKSLEITINFDHPTNSELRMQQRMLLPQRWFEQWLALDEVLSSPKFKLGEGRVVVDASVLLDYDQIMFKGVPLPQKPKDALQILSKLETLQIFRLPTKWSDANQCLVWASDRRKELISGKGVSDYKDELWEELGCTCHGCF
ncbi:hypothetical protein BKA70DRAFT_683567 [Coprinopsis sp. MPI-PUGE-AT-0042]|nr:hypothetical protein BKA70DRAFT_683567 [Coprinopsis sp. MPI-PUGE-AT-0042]